MPNPPDSYAGRGNRRYGPGGGPHARDQVPQALPDDQRLEAGSAQLLRRALLLSFRRLDVSSPVDWPTSPATPRHEHHQALRASAGADHPRGHGSGARGRGWHTFGHTAQNLNLGKTASGSQPPEAGEVLWCARRDSNSRPTGSKVVGVASTGIAPVYYQWFRNTRRRRKRL